MAERSLARDSSGHVPPPKPKRGSYAEHWLKELKMEREKFNVNNLNFYNGGIPRKHQGTFRSGAMGPPGTFHDELEHQEHEDPHQDTDTIR